jgi:hypothetical protein
MQTEDLNQNKHSWGELMSLNLTLFFRGIQNYSMLSDSEINEFLSNI